MRAVAAVAVAAVPAGSSAAWWRLRLALLVTCVLLRSLLSEEWLMEIIASMMEELNRAYHG